MIALQVSFVLLAFSFALFFVPSSQYPYDKATFSTEGVEFKFKNANAILVDTNLDFSSPKRLDLKEFNTTTVLFEPGTYYWKPVGIVEGFPRMFTIDSTVGLDLNEENKTIKNTGNTILNVSLENSKGLSGLVILEMDVEYPVKMENETVYRGEEYEE